MIPLEILKALPPEKRREAFHGLNEAQLAQVVWTLQQGSAQDWRKYQADPVGFVQHALGEAIWSRQIEILNSIRDNKRTAVPACHAPGKSHIAARAVVWWGTVHPPGTARIVTTASTFRQVKNILWPHIRRVVNRHDLPGDVLQVEWKRDGEVIADGFSPADYDETAVQGIHAPHLLVVVDEAGGIGHPLGRALEGLMTGAHTRLLVLGNPPTDDEGSWFEKVCGSPLYNVIPIAVKDTPNFTGEETGWCTACPPEVTAHKVATHLVDEEWVKDVTDEFGDDSAFVEARVHARFPQQVAGKVIPYAWVETSGDLELEPGTIRLGVDVASDGGDEFVVAKADGFNVTIMHRSSGAANANATDVAQMVLQQIEKAERIHKDREITDKVRVKIDAIGVGWGVSSILQTWGADGKHNATIVPVNVAEKARDQVKFSNVRAEMWWNGRQLLQPNDDRGQQMCVEQDRRTMAQLSGPKYSSDGSGRIKIESKKDMRRRSVPSPDRAEAMLLAVYEPPGKKPITAARPLGLHQDNPWAVTK